MPAVQVASSSLAAPAGTLAIHLAPLDTTTSAGGGGSAPSSLSGIPKPRTPVSQIPTNLARTVENEPRSPRGSLIGGSHGRLYSQHSPATAAAAAQVAAEVVTVRLSAAHGRGGDGI